MQINTKIFQTSILLILLSQPLLAQNTWIKRADFGGKGRYGAVAFTIGNRAYVGVGLDNNLNYHDFWEFNPNLNTWSQKADVPVAPKISPIAFSIGGKGYIGCGDGKNDFWQYDPVKDTWTALGPVPGYSRLYPVCFTIGNKGYMATGIAWGGKILLHDLWQYDPATDHWTQKADFPGGKRYIASGFSIGGKGYIGCGIDSNQKVYNDFWEYDTLTDKWTKKADMGLHPRFGGVGYSIGSNGFMGFGFMPGVGNNKDLWEYDTTQNKWTALPSCDQSFPGDGSVAFVLDGNAYVCTGDNRTTFTDIGPYCGSDMWEYGRHTAGVDSKYLATEISIYPVPNTGKFNLQAEKPIKSITIFDIDGRIVYKDPAISGNPFNLNIEISVPGGIYLLKIDSEEGELVKRLVICK
jgi:N-acetylneuraminic acid mutarotase